MNFQTNRKKRHVEALDMETDYLPLKREKRKFDRDKSQRSKFPYQ